MAKDPVCGMTVRESSPYHFVYQGQDFYFCCNGCLNKFQADPNRYLQPQDQKPAPQARRAQSTSAPWILKCALKSPAVALSAAWLWSPKVSRQASSIPAPCIQKSNRRRLAIVPNVAWPWKPKQASSWKILKKKI